MFGAFQTFGKLGAIGKAISAAWSPLALWPNGAASPGMWIDPSLLTASFNDYTGTTPVAVPGTVADSANPVGLALDIRAGAPETLGPELVVNGDFSAGTTGWTGQNGGTCAVVGGELQVTAGADFYGGVYQTVTLVVGRMYLLTATVRCGTAPRAEVRVDYACSPYTGNTTDTILQVYFVAPYASNNIQLNPTLATVGGTCFYGDISVREVPGNHMLQATSAARPLESAYDGQTLGPGNTYDATGYPIFQLYDGVDDGMATAAFSAGTLINGMDCMIPVRRDAGTIAVAGLNNQPQNVFFGICVQGDNVNPDHNGCGTPTTWVNGSQLTGGTSVTRGTLYSALTAGDWHILEYRGLDLSAWTLLNSGEWGGGIMFNGARGDIMLFPSTASTEDKDKARQYLADKYGVTLA